MTITLVRNYQKSMYYNQYSANTHYYATTVIFNISHSLLAIEASLL